MLIFESFNPVLLRCLVCFLMGSIPFAVLVMVGTGIDIRRVGSGNPGFNNVLRVSRPRAMLTLIGDVGKGFLAVWLFYERGDSIVLGWLYGFAVVLGHCYSPFLKFHGGKGIATSGGVIVVLYPVWAAIALTWFAIIRITGSRLNWREAGMTASMAAWLLFTLMMLIFLGRQDALNAAIMTFFLAWRHRQNFRNLVDVAQRGQPA